MKRNPHMAYVGIFAALIMVGCRKTPTQQEAVRPVRAIKVGDLKAIQARKFPGRAKAKDAVDLSFQVSGPLVSLPVDVGSRVKSGDVIAAIDPREFQVALESAQGNLAVPDIKSTSRQNIVNQGRH
jgi:multidrug efflux pump subunit AcrA (membrane-fusion protein)